MNTTSEFATLIDKLARAQLAPIDMAEACARLKELYELEHPTARRGVAGGLARRGKLTDAVSVGYARAVCLETGVSERTIMRYVVLCEAMPRDVRDEVRARKIAPSYGDLCALARLSVEEQRDIAARIHHDPALLLRGALRGQMRKAPTLPQPAEHVEELDFMRAFMLAIGAQKGLRIWRQNVGKVPIRDRTGRVTRVFDAGPPNGAADISGIADIGGMGFRVEIETKAGGGKLSKEQRAWRDMIEGLGGIYIVLTFDDARSVAENVSAAVAAVNEKLAGYRE